MADYDNTNTLVLFKNDKDGNEKRPDYKGTINIEGTEYAVSAWIRTPKSGGDRFLSGPVELKGEPVAANNDEVPF